MEPPERPRTRHGGGDRIITRGPCRGATTAIWRRPPWRRLSRSQRVWQSSPGSATCHHSRVWTGCPEATVRGMLRRVERIPVQPRLGERLPRFGSREVRRVLAGDYEIRCELIDMDVVVLRIFHAREDR